MLGLSRGLSGVAFRYATLPAPLLKGAGAINRSANCERLPELAVHGAQWRVGLDAERIEDFRKEGARSGRGRNVEDLSIGETMLLEPLDVTRSNSRGVARNLAAKVHHHSLRCRQRLR